MRSSCSLLFCGLIVASLGFLVSACSTTKSTTDAASDFTSSTTPGLLFDQEGLVKDSRKVYTFVLFNLDNLKADVAQGQGETLASLRFLLGIPPDDQAAFLTFAQRRYPVLFPSPQTKPADMLHHLYHEMANDLILSVRMAEN